MSDKDKGDLPQEEKVDEQDSDFQRQILEYMRDTRTQFQVVDEQHLKLSPGVSHILQDLSLELIIIDSNYRHVKDWN